MPREERREGPEQSPAGPGAVTLTSAMQEGESLSAYVQRLTDAAAQVPDIEAEVRKLTEHLTYARACHAKLGTLHNFAQYVGKEQKAAGAPVRSVVLDYLVAHGPCKPVQIQDGTGFVKNTVGPALTKLLQDGLVTRENGVYRVAQARPPAPPTPPADVPPPVPAPPTAEPEVQGKVLSILVRPGRTRTEAQLAAYAGVALPRLRDTLTAMHLHGLIREVSPGTWERL